VGDKTLKKFSSILQENITSEDILARFGGDEFVLLLTHITSKKEAFDFIQNLSKTLEMSINIDNHEIFISASIGASLYPNDAKTTKALLKNADIAMYSAKQSGRNCFKCFSQEVSQTMDREHSITHALHTILKNNNKNGELFLKYQPLYNIKDGNIAEFEALIRWENSEGRNILPDEFIPLAEKSNLIEKINLFVINEACKQQSEWQKTKMNNIRININLSGNKIIFEKLLEQFNKNILEMSLSPSLFGIELTERTLNQISDETIQELDKIRKRGMKISIDDFGTDYSSLIYLKKLPITTLKIDKAFICDLTNNSEDKALVKTIIDLGHSLNLDVVAEGVETAEQLKFLKDHACNIAQGYYFNKPLNTEQVFQLKQVA
jgi:predicted signal transduction protein with EAL and GGDEF domain